MQKTKMLVTNPANIRYLTGFVSLAPEAREAYLVESDGARLLITYPHYAQYARKLSKQKNLIKPFIVEIIEPGNTMADVLSAYCMRQNITELKYEEHNLTVAELSAIRKALSGVTLKPVGHRVEQLRMIKTTEEIRQIHRAASVTDQTYDYLLPLLKPGVYEKEIAWKIESIIKEQGYTLSFAPIVAFGKNTSEIHYQLSVNAKLRKNDIVLLDFGARVNGYCSDMTRVIFTGTPKREWLNSYNAVLKAQSAVLLYMNRFIYTKTRSGLSGGTLDSMARDSIAKSRYTPYPHSLGHGVGLDIHEHPRLTVHKDAELKPGMVFTVEPGVYVPGSYGIRIEDLVHLQKNRLEMLSKTTKDVIVIH